MRRVPAFQVGDLRCTRAWRTVAMRCLQGPWQWAVGRRSSLRDVGVMGAAAALPMGTASVATALAKERLSRLICLRPGDARRGCRDSLLACAPCLHPPVADGAPQLDVRDCNQGKGSQNEISGRRERPGSQGRSASRKAWKAWGAPTIVSRPLRAGWIGGAKGLSPGARRISSEADDASGSGVGHGRSRRASEPLGRRNERDRRCASIESDVGTAPARVRGYANRSRADRVIAPRFGPAVAGSPGKVHAALIAAGTHGKRLRSGDHCAAVMSRTAASMPAPASSTGST
jgi:hypothetical protein